MSDADAAKAARAAVDAARSLREQMREDWGHHVEPEETLAAEVDRLRDENARLRAVVEADDGPVAKTMEYLGQVEAERDRLRAVVRKLVKAAGITFEGDTVWYASEEYYGPHLMEPEERAACERALDGSAEVTDE